MAYQIDQSGKIEQTNRQTVVALANGKKKTIKITSVEKQKLIKTILELDKPKKKYVHKIFGALLFLLLKDEGIKESIMVDKEYYGHEPDIKNILLQLFEKYQLKSPEIDFGLVGKKSPAHDSGIRVFRKEDKAVLVVKAKDILEVLYGKPKINKASLRVSTKKGWRSRSGRDNP